MGWKGRSDTCPDDTMVCGAQNGCYAKSLDYCETCGEQCFGRLWGRMRSIGARECIFEVDLNVKQTMWLVK